MPSILRFYVSASILLLSMGSLLGQSRGDLIQATLLETWNETQIRAAYAQLSLPEFLSPIEYDIDILKISYYTRAARVDTLIAASGLLVVPKGDCDFPLAGYGHGTTFYGAIPSDRTSQEWLLGVPFAANGYMTALPDYLGYGETPLEHPHLFIHARSEAWAMVDMLRAARQYATMDSIRLNDQVFLFGYSQGGHVAMAAHRELETNHADEFELTAVAPLSGPYDVSGVQFQDIIEEKPTNSFYLAFVMTSFQYIYGNLWQNPIDAFVPPYDTLIPQYFDRTNPQPVPLPDTAIRMIQPAYAQAILNDSMHPAMVALRDNDLTSWTPQAPTRMYFCEADEVVPYENALVALDSFMFRGAPAVEALSADANLAHGACAGPAIIFSKLWFDSFRAECTIVQDSMPNDSIPTQLQDLLAGDVKIGPNPSQGHLDILEEGSGLNAPLKLELFTLSGMRVSQEELSPGFGQYRWELANLANGLYVLQIRSREGEGRKLIQIRR